MHEMDTKHLLKNRITKYTVKAGYLLMQQHYITQIIYLFNNNLQLKYLHISLIFTIFVLDERGYSS